MNIIKWPEPLKSGDKVALTAPSSPVPSDKLEDAVESIKFLGLKPVIMPSCKMTHGYLAGSDKQRADDINSAFSNKNIKGIFCLRGGYGAMRILPYLDLEMIKNNPKVFAGYSDITALHTVFNHKCGFVTYSNKSKRKLLGVKKSTLDKYGAVSEQTAREMAEGAAEESKADVAVALTGIAGPDGGRKDKPVGLVYISCSVKGKTVVREYHFKGNRAKVRESATSAALVLMRSCILEYFSKVTFGKKEK